jgi:hypothetical protein
MNGASRQCEFATPEPVAHLIVGPADQDGKEVDLLL